MSSLRKWSFQNQFVVFSGAVGADAWGEDLNEPPAIAGVLVNLGLVALSGLGSGTKPALTEADELVLELWFHGMRECWEKGWREACGRAITQTCGNWMRSRVRRACLGWWRGVAPALDAVARPTGEVASPAGDAEVPPDERLPPGKGFVKQSV